MTLLPTPSDKGVEKLQRYYREQHNMEVRAEKAYEVLSGLMRFVYLTQIRPPVEEEPAAASPSKRGEGSTP